MICVCYRRRLWRLWCAVVELMVVSRLDVDSRLPVVMQIPKRRCPYMVGRRRRRWRHDVVLIFGGDARVLFHHITRKRATAAKVAKPAQNTIVNIAVNVLDYRYFIDLKGKNMINNLIIIDGKAILLMLKIYYYFINCKSYSFIIIY